MTEYGFAGKVKTRKEVSIVALSAGISIFYFLLTFDGQSSNVISFFCICLLWGSCF